MTNSVCTKALREFVGDSAVEQLLLPSTKALNEATEHNGPLEFIYGDEEWNVLKTAYDTENDRYLISTYGRLYNRRFDHLVKLHNKGGRYTPKGYKWSLGNQAALVCSMGAISRLVSFTFNSLDDPRNRTTIEKVLKNDFEGNLNWDNLDIAIKRFLPSVLIVNHINHIPSNNYYENLEWTTPQDNSRKAAAYRNGTLPEMYDEVPRVLQKN